MFRVLKPVYTQTSEPIYKAQTHSATRVQVGYFEAVSWRDVGSANSMEEAKAKFGGSPVLEWVRRVH